MNQHAPPTPALMMMEEDGCATQHTKSAPADLALVIALTLACILFVLTSAA